MSLLTEENEMAIVNPILCRVLSIQVEVEQKYGLKVVCVYLSEQSRVCFIH